MGISDVAGLGDVGRAGGRRLCAGRRTSRSGRWGPAGTGRRHDAGTRARCAARGAGRTGSRRAGASGGCAARPPGRCVGRGTGADASCARSGGAGRFARFRAGGTAGSGLFGVVVLRRVRRGPVHAAVRRTRSEPGGTSGNFQGLPDRFARRQVADALRARSRVRGQP